MDIRSFGGSLLAFEETLPDRHRAWTQAEEDAYYLQHAPSERRIPRIASVVAAVCLGLVTVGLWLH